MTNTNELLLPDRTANMGSAPLTCSYCTVYYTKILQQTYFKNIQHHIIFQYGLHTLNYGAVTPKWADLYYCHVVFTDGNQPVGMGGGLWQDIHTGHTKKWLNSQYLLI